FVPGDVYVFEVIEKRGAGIPGSDIGALDDVVTFEGGNGDGLEALKPEVFDGGLEIPDDLLEYGLIPVDEVPVVDGHDEVAYAKQAHDAGVAVGLNHQPLLGVDDEHGQIRSGRARGHVAGVLLVSWGVGNNKPTVGGGEEAVGNIDGDALFALGLKAIEQE